MQIIHIIEVGTGPQGILKAGHEFRVGTQVDEMLMSIAVEMRGGNDGFGELNHNISIFFGLFGVAVRVQFVSHQDDPD